MTHPADTPALTDSTTISTGPHNEEQQPADKKVMTIEAEGVPLSKAERARIKRGNEKIAHAVAKVAQEAFRAPIHAAMGDPIWVTAKNGRTLDEWWALCHAALEGVPNDERNEVTVTVANATPCWFECPRCHNQWEDLPWQSGCWPCLAEAQNGGNQVYGEAYDKEHERLTGQGSPRTRTVQG